MQKMIHAIEYIAKPLNIGTNLSIVHVLWAMVSGKFIESRGAVHTALKLIGCTDPEIRRGSAVLRTRQWTIDELIERWREWVALEGGWKRSDYEGYHPVACDIVVFPRLQLKGWVAKLYRGTFGKAVKAVGFGLIVDFGRYEDGRAGLLRKIVRCKNEEGSEKKLSLDLLKTVSTLLGKAGVFVHDAGVSVKEVQEAGIAPFVIRLPKNCVAYWNYLPKNAHGNRIYGDIIRPLARYRKEKLVGSTNDPTGRFSFQYQGRTITGMYWHNVVANGVPANSDTALTYTIWFFLTRNSKPLGYWHRTLMPQRKQFFGYIQTVGVQNNYH